ncbi:MAG TPA: biotin/lipoyl-containing protein, partial [Thermoplasmata archaeon]|nr:biotin/lipoyl-containing protein [Thermoplasmata archaeon]
MPFEFRLPDIGEGVAEGEVVKWFVHEGDTIAEDAPLVSVLTDKANVEIPSPKSGKILRIHAQVGEKVKVGGLLVTIGTEGETAPTAPPTATPAPPQPSPAAVPASAPSVGNGPVLATPFVRRLAAERGIDLTQIRGSGPDGRITEADLLPGDRGEKPAGPAPPSNASAPTPAREPPP